VTRALILSQCYLKTEEQGRLLAVSLGLARRLNPDTPILLMDNASPLEVLAFIDGMPGIDIHRFPDAIGHFSHKFEDEMSPEERRDGPGRAIMTGLQMAIDSGYDRLAYIEGDALFACPIEEGFAQMRHPFACLPRGKWGYLDWNVFWVASLQWLKEFDFIGKYDWPNQKQGPGNEGERVYERLLANHLDVLPFRGARGEEYINADNLRAIFPTGVDWLTHVSRETFAEFLRGNGHPDLMEKL
jgi:hypothetical protein